jgi:hypothetical protein
MPDSGPVIRPLREDEYDAFVVRAKAFYVSDMVAAGIDPVVANAKSEHDFPQLLSEGLATPSHLVYAIEDEGRSAGYLRAWADRPRPGSRAPSIRPTAAVR